MCVKWNLRVVWICISLMVNDIQLLFMYLLAIYMSSLEIFVFSFCVLFCFWTRTLANRLIVPSLKYTGCYNSRFLRFGYGFFRDLMSQLAYRASDSWSFSLSIGAILFATGPLLKVAKSQWHHSMLISSSHFPFHLSSYFCSLVQKTIFFLIFTRAKNLFIISKGIYLAHDLYNCCLQTQIIVMPQISNNMLRNFLF